MSRVAGLFLACVAVATAKAQDNAIISASDAFGERSGIEQSGLYSESQVRGFDLNDSGAYRIDEAYFNRAASLDDTVLSGAGVRVGVNASRLTYPAPSGVVTYRLRETGPKNELRLGAGFRDYGTRVIQGDGSLHTGVFRFAGGVIWRPLQRYSKGYEGSGFNIGGVGEWEIASDQRLRVFASRYQRHYDGDYAVATSEPALPPPLRSLHQYSPSWAETAAVSTNAGVFYDARLGGFTFDLSAFHSIFDIEQVDFTLISADRLGNAIATTLRSPARTKNADSVEARIGREFDTGQVHHLATFSVRAGRTSIDLVSNIAIPLGAFQLAGASPEAPEIEWTGTRGKDKVERVTASTGYALSWDDRLQLRFGVHRTRYDKSVLSIAGVQTGRVSESTHYNASAIFNLTDRALLFGSWVTGLEESGVAPVSASNRDAVLPPGDAEQFELGIRYALSPRLSFISALFDISKPSQSFHSDGSFGLVGEVRHRGVEASVTGKLNDRINIVSGVVAFDSKVSGPLVDAGVVGTEDVGVSQIAATTSVDYRLTDAWSLDATLNYSGERWVDTANTLRAPDITILSLGTRYNFVIGERRTALRILVSNLTGEEGYIVARSGLLSPVAPRTIRAVLTIGIGSEH
ncbi:MAG: TonB-dependent receptor [Parvularculaceae bacterium]